MKYRSLVAKRLQLKSNNRSKVRVSAIAVSTILLSEVILGNISGLISVAQTADPSTPVEMCTLTNDLQFVPLSEEDVTIGRLGWPTTTGTSTRTYTNVNGSGIDIRATAYIADGTATTTLTQFSSFAGSPREGGLYQEGTNWQLSLEFFETGTSTPAAVTSVRHVLEDFESEDAGAETVGDFAITPVGGASTLLNTATEVSVLATFSGTPPIVDNFFQGYYFGEAGPQPGKWVIAEAAVGQAYTRIDVDLLNGGNLNPLVNLCQPAGKDRGDAPMSYGDASHIITSSASVYLGNTTIPDLEFDPLNSANGGTDGVGDDNTESDDEDGVTVPASINPDSTISLPITVTGTGALNAWIDWDSSGTFDAGEQIATNIVDGGAGDTDSNVDGTITLSVSAPATATLGNTYARFRYSTDTGIGPIGSASDGEVEDYRVAIAAAPATIICPTEASGSGSGYATSGTGLYVEDIFWLDWSCDTTTQFNPGDIVQKTWTGPHGLEVTATVSNITQTLSPYNTGDFSGDRLDDLYGGVNPIGLRNLIQAEDPTYDVTFSMTLNGVPIPADIVTAEAESTDAPDFPTRESATWTTDGTAWQPLEAAPNSSLNITFSNEGKTIMMDDFANGGFGTILALTEDVSTISVDMQAGGIEAIAFGIMAPFDFGDALGYAPSGGHLARRTAVGGSQPTTSTPANNLTFATLENNSPFLGVIGPDIDRAENSDQATVNADGDDNGTLDDEDGITLTTLTEGDTSYTIPAGNIVANSIGDATLHAWVDFNQNSSFDPTEYQSVVVTNGTPSGDLVWNSLSGISSGTTYARFRITTDTNITSATPSSGAFDGEMEDYQMAIAAFVSNPNMILVKRVTAIASNAITGFFDDVGTDDDTDPQWPVNYIQGSVDTSTVQPGQEIEYTIYFLSNGNVDLTDINICDHIPANTTYVDNSAELVFGSDGAIPLNNARDTDEGEYFAPNTSILATDVPDVGICRSDRDPSQDFPAAENTNGALWVEVDKNTTPIPVGQAGFVRFRVTVNQTSIP